MHPNACNTDSTPQKDEEIDLKTSLAKQLFLQVFQIQEATKEATLKALQDAGISLTVVGETREKKDFDPLVNGTNGLYLDIDKNFADLLNVQFANKVVETVQKGRVFKVQTDKYELISKTHRVAKAKPQTPSIQTPATPTPTPQKPAVVTL